MILKEAAQALNCWRSIILLEKERKRIATAALLRLKNRELTRSILGWHEKSSEARRLQKNLKRAALSLLHRASSLAFTTWVAAAVQGQAEAEAMRRAAGRLRNRGLSASFLAWQDLRILILKARRAMAKVVMRGVARGFEAMVSHAEESKRGKAVTGVAIRRLRNKTVASVFLTWLETTRKRRGGARVAVMGAMHPLLMGLRAWRIRAEKRRRSAIKHSGDDLEGLRRTWSAMNLDTQTSSLNLTLAWDEKAAA